MSRGTGPSTSSEDTRGFIHSSHAFLGTRFAEHPGMASQDGASDTPRSDGCCASIRTAGCAGVLVVPPNFEGKIARHVSFQQVSRSDGVLTHVP